MKSNSSKRSRSFVRRSEKNLSRWKTKLETFKQEYYTALANKRAEKKRIKQLKKDIKVLVAAQSHVQRIAQETQHSGQRKIVAVVSKCLLTVFDEPYSFQIRFEKKRGKMEGKLLFVRDGEEFDDPKNQIGGAVLDLAAFALRFACILSSRPALRHLIVLDEPFKHLHRDLLPVAAKLVYELAKETKTQVVMITHAKALEIGRVERV